MPKPYDHAYIEVNKVVVCDDRNDGRSSYFDVKQVYVRVEGEREPIEISRLMDLWHSADDN